MALGEGGLSLGSLRQPGEDDPESNLTPIEVILDGGDAPQVDTDNGGSIELPGGFLRVQIGPAVVPKKDTQFDSNLAESIEQGKLGNLASNLIDLIEQDDQSRSEWVQDRAKGLKLLGLKIEDPRSSGADGSAPLDGMSQYRDTLLMEAVVRFAANAFSELCPIDGPAKVGEDNNGVDPNEDDLADDFEKAFNHYLTVTDKPWVPDTDQMILRIGVDGCQFKKVYHDPILRRPVSRSVSPDDLIVSNAATSIYEAGRITHRSRMRRSNLKRMQLLGVYRDVKLQDPGYAVNDAIKEEVERVSGVRENQGDESLDRNYEILECYCELDLEGFEHETDGKPDGLALPYKVVIEKETREILEIRRNYEENDDLCLPKVFFVQFPFIRGFGFYGIGLSHLLGNTTVALTAAKRELIDLGMFANFPGLLFSKDATRQDSMVIRVPPGGGKGIETNGLPISSMVMPLPYQQPGPVWVQFLQELAQDGQRLGGTAEVMVGEGRNDAPVGTTLALIEQAIKPMMAVHKRLCASESDEMQLLCERFREDPEALWKFAKKGALKPKQKWTKERLLQALDDNNIVCRADPNTASHLQRIMRNAALYQMAKDDPGAFNVREIRQACIRGIGFANPDQFLAPANAPGPPPNPKDQADALSAQADLLDAQNHRAELAYKAQNSSVEDQNRDLDRQSDERIAQMQLEGEQLRAAASEKADAAKHVASLISDHVSEHREQQHDQLSQALQQAHETSMMVGEHQHDRRLSDMDHKNKLEQIKKTPKPAAPAGKGKK